MTETEFGILPSEDGWDKFYALAGNKPLAEQQHSELCAALVQIFGYQTPERNDLDNTITFRTKSCVCIVRTWGVFIEYAHSPEHGTRGVNRLWNVIGYCVTHGVPVFNWDFFAGDATSG